MATVLDIGILQHFQIVFGWLFVFVATYALLGLTKTLGDNKGLHAVLAVCFATLFSFSSKAMAVVTGAAPWFVVLLVMILFLLMGTRFAFGVETGDKVLLQLFGESTAGWWIFIPVVVIMGILLATTLGPDVLPHAEDGSSADSGDTSTATSDITTNILNTLFHPKILGTGVILMIAVFAIIALCSTPVKWG